MTACSTNTCGVGGWGGPLPGDPDNNSVLTATPAFGGIDVSWSYPAVNPQAVAHTLLYRGLTDDFNSALQLAVVSGSFYYDKTDTTGLVQYFYWIKIVSVNGTVGELIGPASATAKPTIDQMIDLLSGRINEGVLAQALRTDIARIQLVSAELQAEINNRNAANAATSLLLSEMQAEINASLGIITDEITGRQEGESALLTQVNAAAAAIALESTTRAAEIQQEAADRAAAILTEENARLSAIQAESAARVQAILNEATARQTAIGTLNAAVLSEQNSRITAVAAEASARDTLATQLRGNYTGTDLSQVSSGLIYSERVSRITAVENLQTQINTLSAASSGDFGDLLAAVQSEQTARVAGDEANATSITTLGSRLSNVKDKNGVATNKSLEATLVDDRQSRVDGDAALSSQITTLTTSVTNNYNTLNSAIQTEASTRSTAVSTEATARETLASQIRGSYSGTNPALLTSGILYNERQARITADEAIVSSVTALTATVNTNTAAITTESTTRANADTALSNQFTTLSAQVNNATTGLPATRATLLNNYYTKTATDSAISAATLNLVSTTGLNTALASYPTTASLTQNYYTKSATDAAISSATTTLTSNFNTTLGTYVPTATLTNNYYTKTATDSAISTASTNLTSAFDVKLGLYTPTATLTNLYYTKTQADSAISAATQNLVSTTALNTALSGYTTTAVLNTNYYTKTAANSAISAAVQNLVSTTALNTALSSYPTTATLTTNYYTKTAVDSAISSATQNLVSTTGLATTLAAYPTTATLTNSYFTQAQTNSAISLATQNLVSNTGLATTLGGYVTNATLTTNHYTKTQTDSAISSATSTLVSNAGLNTALGAYTTTAALQTNYYTKAQSDSAISAAITTSQLTLNGNIASAQSTLQTNIDTVNGKVTAIGARYTAVVSANGLVGGFGVYNNGTVIQAGFDVNEFWVGSSQTNKRKPFIISNGVTYIDDAAINKLTFTKLRDEAGAVMIENGKIKANYLQVISISGGNYTGYNWPASGGGFYLGPSGLLLGRYDAQNPASTYFQFDVATGVLYANGFSIVNGNATFSGSLTAATGTFTGKLTAAVQQYASPASWILGFSGTGSTYIPVGGFLDSQTVNSSSITVGNLYEISAPAAELVYKLGWGVMYPQYDGTDGWYVCSIKVQGLDGGVKPVAAFALRVRELHDLYYLYGDVGSHVSTSTLLDLKKTIPFSAMESVRPFCSGVATASSLSFLYKFSILSTAAKNKFFAEFSVGEVQDCPSNDQNIYKLNAGRGAANNNWDYAGFKPHLFITQYS